MIVNRTGQVTRRFRMRYKVDMPESKTSSSGATSPNLTVFRDAVGVPLTPDERAVRKAQLLRRLEQVKIKATRSTEPINDVKDGA